KRAQAARADLLQLEQEQKRLEQELPQDLHGRLAGLLARQQARRREIELVDARQLEALTPAGEAILQLQEVGFRAAQLALQDEMMRQAQVAEEAEDQLLLAVSGPLDTLREAAATKTMLLYELTSIARGAAKGVEVVVNGRD